MKKIVVLKNIPQYKTEIEKIAPEWEVVFTANKEEAQQHLPEAEIVAGWSSAVEDLLVEPDLKLKWLQYFSAGVDDLPLAKLEKQKIILTSASGVHPYQISETIFASMLALARRVPDWVSFQQQSRWEKEEMWSRKYDEIHEKTLGILGAGTIGKEVAKIAKAFSMTTIGLATTDEPREHFDKMYATKDMNLMLSECSSIVNLLPHTPKTERVIDAKAFEAMQKGTTYFAFGRGITTVTDDLVAALKSGHLLAAGLDVVDPEPLGADSPLWKMENVLIAPHMSGATSNYDQRAMGIFMENLKNYVSGKPISRSRINYKTGY